MVSLNSGKSTGHILLTLSVQPTGSQYDPTVVPWAMLPGDPKTSLQVSSLAPPAHSSLSMQDLSAEHFW